MKPLNSFLLSIIIIVFVLMLAAAISIGLIKLTQPKKSNRLHLKDNRLQPVQVPSDSTWFFMHSEIKK